MEREDGSEIFLYHNESKGSEGNPLGEERRARVGDIEEGIVHHCTSDDDEWPVDMMQLENEKKILWFPLMHSYLEWDELTFYVFRVMNTYFIRIFMTEDKRIVNEERYCYGRYMYNRMMYFGNHHEISKVFKKLVLDHHLFTFGLNPVDCWIAWTLRIHFKGKARYRLSKETNTQLYVERIAKEERVLSEWEAKRRKMEGWNREMAETLHREVRQWMRWRKYRMYGVIGVIFVICMFFLHRNVPYIT